MAKTTRTLLMEAAMTTMHLAALREIQMRGIHAPDEQKDARDEINSLRRQATELRELAEASKAFDAVLLAFPDACADEVKTMEIIITLKGDEGDVLAMGHARI